MTDMQYTCHAPSGDYARILFSEYMSVRWVWFVLPFAFFCCLAIFDLRFVLVAAMVLFVVIPMIMALLYINFMLTLTTRWSIAEKTIVSTQAGLQLTFDNGSQQLIAPDAVSRFFTRNGYLCFELRERRFQYFIVPMSVFQGDVNKLNTFVAPFL